MFDMFDLYQGLATAGSEKARFRNDHGQRPWLREAGKSLTDGLPRIGFPSASIGLGLPVEKSTYIPPWWYE